ncbi:hypothetical protein ACIA8K_12350 [Catenuloplanes sp. NPDC051500]
MADAGGLRRDPGTTWPHVANTHLNVGTRAVHPDGTWTVPRLAAIHSNTA